MIPMRMRDQNCGDGLAAQRLEQSVDMLFAIGARIDDRDFAGADDIGAGSGEGHRPRIAGRHAAHQRRQAHEFARRSREGAVERNLVCRRLAAAHGRILVHV